MTATWCIKTLFEKRCCECVRMSRSTGHEYRKKQEGKGQWDGKKIMEPGKAKWQGDEHVSRPNPRGCDSYLVRMRVKQEET